MRMFDDKFQSCKFTRSLDLLFEHVIILQPKNIMYQNEYRFASHLVFHFRPTNKIFLERLLLRILSTKLLLQNYIP